jgi:hypothetical protein
MFRYITEQKWTVKISEIILAKVVCVRRISGTWTDKYLNE